jgi:hypothetical protein
MRREAVSLVLPLVAALAVACGWGIVSADAPSARSPGVSLRQVGVSSSITRQFESYSYGLGGLSRYSAPESNVLSSSVAGAAAFGSVKVEPGLTPGGMDVAPVGKGVVYSTFVPVITPGVGEGAMADSIISHQVAAGMARMYLDAVGTLTKSTAAQEPITSLIPSTPSHYGSLIAEGERLFRAGDYEAAFNKFQVANYIGGHDPDSLLSLAHASFASTRYSYARPAYYLRQTLKYMPELPLLPIRPREFYNEQASFVQHEIQLEEYLQRHPTDGEANLVLAYIRWFSDAPDGPKQAQAALARALASPQASPEAIEIIETFHAGMLASGRISGKLQPATAPASSSRPAGVEAPAPLPRSSDGG